MESCKDRREARKGSVGSEPSAPCGRNSEAEHRELQGATEGRDYARSPDPSSLRRGFRGEAPNVPQIAKRSRKSSQGAKRALTGFSCMARFDPDSAFVSSIPGAFMPAKQGTKPRGCLKGPKPLQVKSAAARRFRYPFLCARGTRRNGCQPDEGLRSRISSEP